MIRCRKIILWCWLFLVSGKLRKFHCCWMCRKEKSATKTIIMMMIEDIERKPPQFRRLQVGGSCEAYEQKCDVRGVRQSLGKVREVERERERWKDWATRLGARPGNTCPSYFSFSLGYTFWYRNVCPDVLLLHAVARDPFSELQEEEKTSPQEERKRIREKEHEGWGRFRKR